MKIRSINAKKPRVPAKFRRLKAGDEFKHIETGKLVVVQFTIMVGNRLRVWFTRGAWVWYKQLIENYK